MNNNTVEVIKQEDRKAGKKFVIIMCVMFALGMVFGLGGVIAVGYASRKGLHFLDIWNQVQREISYWSGYVLILITIILSVLTYLILRKNKKKYDAWDKEDETYLEEMEQSLNKGILMTSVMTVLDMILFGLAAYLLIEKARTSLIITLIVTVFYIASMAAVMFLQKEIVNLVKEMNPEKRGSVYDMKFHEKWMESCDEAEQLMVYKATYHTYRTLNKTCVIFVLVYVLAGMFAEIGILPLLTAGAFWLIMSVSYIMESIRLERGK